MIWTVWKQTILLLTLFSTAILAQTQPAVASTQSPTSNLNPSTTNANETAQRSPTSLSSLAALPPANFAGAGALYNPSGSPRITGWATYAKLVDVKSESYFFTTEDAFLGSLKTLNITTSLRVGLATKLKEIGPVKVFAIADGGGATSGSSSGGAASGGGIATIHLKGNYYLMVGYRAVVLQNISGTPKLYEAGIGKSW